MKSAFTRLLFISITSFIFNFQDAYAKKLPPPLAAGTYSIGPSASYLPPWGDPAYSGTYTNLKAAVLDLNANGAAGPVIFEFQLNYANTETFPITITYQGTAAAPAIIRVRSDLIGQVNITGNGGTGSSGALGLIVLEGADFIHFNGNIGSTLNGSNGIKLNTTAVFGAPVINLRNDATHNTFTGLEIWGSGSGNGIQLSTVGGITGDDYTTIQYCSFPGPACSGSPCATPFAAVYSESTGNSTCKNDHILIYQNIIYNNANGVHASNSGNSGYWEVLDNHFYSTSTLNGSFHYGMILQVDNGSGPVNVSGNYIGGSAPFAAGTPMINNDPAMVCIWVSVANSAPSPSSITNNIIKNISFTSLSASPSVLAILVQSGAVNITNNTIGDPSVTNDISFNTNTPASFTGISNTSSQTQYAVSISNNAIGNVRMQQTTNTAGAGEFLGYRYVNNAIHTVSLSANTIKGINFGGLAGFQCMNISGGIGGASNTIVANNKFENIQQANSALNSFFRGIYCNTAPASYTGNRIGSYSNPNDIVVAGKGLHSGIQVFQSGLAAISILNDTVANITFTQSDNTTKFTAIDHTSSVSGSSVSGNIIKNISSAGTRSNVETDAASGFALVGIYTGGPGTLISNNLITGLHATATGNVNPVVAAICPLYTDNNISANKIYDLTNTATGTSNYPVIFGIVTSSILGTGTCSNNMISLQNGSNNNTVRIYGIYDKANTGTVHNFYHNSIAIGGNETGTGRAASFWRTGSAGTLSLRNNIIYNNRTGGGKYYAIVHESGNAATWGTSNYNDLFAANTNTIGAWPLATDKTFTGWKSVAGDANSKNSDVWFIDNPTDLHLLSNANCALDAAGTSSGVVTDIDAEARNASTPDIGADEFTNTFSVNAGTDQVVCGSTAVLAGNTILPLGIGTWSVTSGTGSFSPDINTAGATVNGLSTTLNTFKWMVTSGSCSGNATVNITSNIASTDPSGLSSSLTEICNGITTGTITFTVNGGSLGTNATWKLYNANPAVGSPTPLASSATATFTGIVLPSVTTTYFVRAEGTAGPCPPNTNAASVIVTVNSPVTWYYDEDGDGFYTASPVEACNNPGTGYTTTVTFAGDNCASVSNPGQEDNDNDGTGDVCDPDDDNDGVPDANDNCALMSNTDQTDTDNDGVGNMCDTDDDNDGILDVNDNCGLVSNTSQTDTDGDGLGNTCDADDDNDGVPDTNDNCSLNTNAGQTDTDNDGIGDECDNDDDGDGIPDVTDNCPLMSNTNQTDTDHDGMGDICDPDSDNDGIPDVIDNCPLISNTSQTDTDHDGIGDTCDTDDDNDGIPDTNDNCPLISNTNQTDTDNDGIGDACDDDDDGDGIPDVTDNCRQISNTNQTDTDNDGIGNTCDTDDDNDGVSDATDNCPLISNTNQTDMDNDGIGDTCDNDDDGDGIPDVTDNCPLISNTNQADTDNDGDGDLCDNDDDGDGVPDATDNCPLVSNINQTDSDNDGIGNICDNDDDGDGIPDANDNCPLVSNPNQEDNDNDGQGDACDADNENPTITCLSNQLRYTDPGKCEYQASGSEFDPTTFADNYPGATIKNNYNNSSTLAGAIFNKGTIAVTWTVTDASGHTSACSFDVKVEDHQKPTIACPASLTLPAGQNSATWIEPSGNDNCPGWTVARTGPGPGSPLPPGTTTVSYKVTDASGNFENCSFTITVTGSALTATCKANTTDNTLYFGYSGDQTETITVTPVGGTGPYTVQIKLSRPLLCNQVNDAGDEVWLPASGGTTINNNCPGYPALAGLAPVSTKSILSGSYTVTVTLMGDADVIATITDANGFSYTCSIHIRADDVRCFSGNSGKAKITLCHKTGSTKNPCIKMCVDEDAVAEHLAHGDFLGNCTSNCVAPSMARSAIQPQVTIINPIEGKLRVKVMPNPTSSFFMLGIHSINKDRIKITVWDVAGRVIEKRTDVVANGILQIGQKFRPGFYIAEILQGKERITLRLIKE